MAEKEERILIARSTDYTISDTKDGALFEGKIAPHNANVFSRQEAIERMAKALIRADYPHAQESVWDMRWKEEASKDYYLIMAEAALNALLEGK